MSIEIYSVSYSTTIGQDGLQIVNSFLTTDVLPKYNKLHNLAMQLCLDFEECVWSDFARQHILKHLPIRYSLPIKNSFIMHYECLLLTFKVRCYEQVLDTLTYWHHTGCPPVRLLQHNGS